MGHHPGASFPPFQPPTRTKTYLTRPGSPTRILETIWNNLTDILNESGHSLIHNMATVYYSAVLHLIQKKV
jgi:hypothetical protein